MHEAALSGDIVDAAAAFSASWQLGMAAGPPIWFGKDDAEVLYAKGIALLAAYQPPERIVGVEQPFSFRLDPALPPIEGRIDLIRRDPQDRVVLADVKTASTRTLTETGAVAAQLGLYDLVFAADLHEIIVLGKLATPTITIQPIDPWPEARVRQHYREVYDAMRAGIRFAVRGWPCDGCPFAERCIREG